MFGTSGGTPGGDAGFGAQQGYQTRSRGRGRHEAPEERFVEGDLFGSTKRQSFRSTERPTGLPPRAAYYDGPGAVGGGGGGGIGAGGHSQTPRVQPSPFARGPGVQPSPFARAPTPTNTFFPTAPGSAYGGARYSQVSPATDPRQSNQRGFSPTVGFGSEVALVPVEAGGAGGGGQNVMDDGDDDDDDDMPTRSLADDPDVRGEGRRPADGLRYRRGGGGGGGGVGGGRGIVGGGFDADEPDTHRDTWVVVWGVPPGSANEVLTRFLQFGHVVEQRGQPGSNWLYLKYATRLQAEKALAAGHGSRLTATVMLGVQKVPDDETWQSLREGRIPPLSTGQPVLASAARGRVPNGDAMEVDDADLLDAPPQRPRGDKSVCGRIMALFGFY